MRDNADLLNAVVCGLEARGKVRIIPETGAAPKDAPVAELKRLLHEGIIKRMRRTPTIVDERNDDGVFGCLRVTLDEQRSAA